MSREFGSYTSGYLHDHTLQDAMDIQGAEAQCCKMWGALWGRLAEIAYQIASVEAGDSSEGTAIVNMLATIPQLKVELRKVEQCLEPYQCVAEEAIRRHVEAVSK